ncbi:MAG TPA: symmetrical bis(5'-nucleosyl)-tetraphosphatase [Thermoanaerobaculales bacterium]|nr:symmetrical bis(5'-nucleosyl)-tetraphosphatase [Thermoanaerobaculales bacterium]HQP42865.1 symmetrical bis(5'-nucleosyl)-tetraphosphatase [Thermoanaerobaculales bacterium]
MADWVIGDVHGCWVTLQRLLERIRWDRDRDRLWLIGDLVNRGPRSLEVLRWAAGHPGVDAILGNHDLHVLARNAALVDAKAGDRLDEVLAADDSERLLDWLRRRPFLHRIGDTVLVHAGLLPQWGWVEASALAGSAGLHLEALLPRLARRPRPRWSAEATGDERLAAAISIFTRLRVVRADGRPKLSFTAAPESAPAGCRPWYETARLVAEGARAIFGHWAMMGFRREPGAVCIDSGCVYGGRLTAFRLDDDAAVHEPVAADEVAQVED